MLIEGSCHCGAVRFKVQSTHPVPYQRCYCSICRKTGGGPYMINTEADANTLQVMGEQHVATYRALIERDGAQVPSRHQRKFCRECGSHLWAWNERWPDLLHPVAASIDTEMPPPPECVHMMVGSKASWVEVEGKPGDAVFDEYPEESLANWHDSRGLTVD